MTVEFFQKKIEMLRSEIEQIENEIKSYLSLGIDYDFDAAYLLLYSDNFDLFICKYSLGSSMFDLELQFSSVISSLNLYVKNRPTNNPVDYIGRLGVAKYTEALFLTSIALLLKIKDAEFEYLIKLLNIKGRDALYDRLISSRVQLEKISNKINYPETYNGLLSAMDAPKQEQPLLARIFLKNWYKSMRNAPWYDLHKKSGGFTGYWAWEVAGVAYASNIDDSSFMDMPFYPKDLANFARDQ